MNPFSLGLPTSTVIAREPRNPMEVWVINHAVKHNKRATLVGGKVVLPTESHLKCILHEWGQEAGGMDAKLTKVRLWAVKSDPYLDVRQINLAKATNDTCPPELAATPVTGHYGCPDHIFLADVIGTPYPRDGEAASCQRINVSDVKFTASAAKSKFGAQHDLVLLVYRLYLLGRPVLNSDFGDMRKLRRELPDMLRTFGIAA